MFLIILYNKLFIIDKPTTHSTCYYLMLFVSSCDLRFVFSVTFKTLLTFFKLISKIFFKDKFWLILNISITSQFKFLKSNNINLNIYTNLIKNLQRFNQLKVNTYFHKINWINFNKIFVIKNFSFCSSYKI